MNSLLQVRVTGILIEDERILLVKQSVSAEHDKNIVSFLI